MEELKNENDFIIGKRYWLDEQKDISGVYLGLSKIGRNTEFVWGRFGSLENNYCYIKDGEGCVDFILAQGGFYEV